MNTATPTNPPASELECLRQILDLLQKQEATWQREKRITQDESKRWQWAALHTQIWSNLSVMAIFLASVSVGLLSLAHDTFSSRDHNAPGKRTDDVANAFWYLSISLSLIVAGDAAIGGSIDAASGLGSQVLVGKVCAQYNIAYRLSRSRFKLALRAVSDEPLADSNTEALVRHLVDYSSTIIQRLLILAVLCTIMGLFVFVWAEQTLPVALTFSVSIAGVYVLTRTALVYESYHPSVALEHTH